MKFKSLALSLMVYSIATTTSFATTDLPFNQQLKDLINENFQSNDGVMSEDKILKYQENIELRKAQVENAMYNYLTKYEGEKDKNALEDIKEEGLIKIYEMILAHIEELRNAKSSYEANMIAQKILELDYSSKVEGVETKLSAQLDYVKANLKKWSIHKTNAPDGEASNLIDPKTGEFYTQHELDEMKKRGEDLSLLNPPAENSFWTQYDIENSNLEEVYRGGKHRMYEGVDLSFPDHRDCDFHKVRKTQSKPKLDVKCDINGEQIKFKLKLGSEMHSEITTASLISLLGFHHDPSKYYQNFKMTLKKGMSYKEFVQDYESYFEGEKYPLSEYIKEKGKDSKGRTYVIFHEVLVEKKPEELFRVGPWAWGETGHRGNRAARAILLFNMWVANLDLKEAENNKLTLKFKDDGSYDMFHYQHDMGFAFGKSFREKPNSYQWNIVNNVTDTAIHMNFRNFQPNSGFDHVTYSDAKWMVRLIARLSREQITDAVKIGGWPHEVELLLIEKLIARRNQLVEAFDLSNEYKEIAYDRYISTENGILNRGYLTQTKFEGYTQDFGRELYYLLMPMYEMLENTAVKAAQAALGVFDEFEFNGSQFGFDNDYIGKIEVKIKRRVVPNISPTGDDDAFLVEDKMQIRFGLGVGMIFKGMGYYIKNYTLIYPARSRHEGNFAGNFIVNALLPWQVRANKLPEKYVLILEDGIEALAEAEFSDTLKIAEVELEGGVGRLGRTVISNKNNTYQVYEDHSAYHRYAAQINAELVILRLPVFRYNYMGGMLNREAYRVDYKDKKKEQALDALDDYILRGDISTIESMAEKSEITTDFVSKRSQFNFFGLFQKKYRHRTDDIVHMSYGSDDDDDLEVINTVEKFQIKARKKTDWFFFGDGEEKERNITFVGEKAEGNIINSMIHLQIDIDDMHTHTVELSKQYIDFVNKTANDPNFIDFDPTVHTKNDIWGNTIMLVDYLYTENALRKLMETDKAVYWKYFRESTGWSQEQIDYYKNYSRRVRGSVVQRQNKYSREKKLIRTMEDFLKYVDKANKAKTDREMYTHLTNGIFKSTYKSQGSYVSHILSVINKIVGMDDRYMSALIAQKDGNENKYPARTPLYNEQGNKLDLYLHYYEFEFDNPKWVWKNFDLQ